MFDAGTLIFQEFMAGEKLSLATIQGAILEFLRGRDDAVVFGAQAVNAYVNEPRMSQAISLLSPRASELAKELQTFLKERFHIAIRIREVAKGKGCRLFQVRKSGNRHLIDIRTAGSLPLSQRISGVLIAAPAELIAQKVIAYHQRRGQPKSGTDWRDLAMLLLAFPKLKQKSSPVADRLKAAGAAPAVFDLWNELVSQKIKPSIEEDEF